MSAEEPRCLIRLNGKNPEATTHDVDVVSWAHERPEDKSPTSLSVCAEGNEQSMTAPNEPVIKCLNADIASSQKANFPSSLR